MADYQHLRRAPKTSEIKTGDKTQISLAEAGLSFSAADLLRTGRFIVNAVNEALWWTEYLKLRADPIFSGNGVPHGNNQPVVLTPGLGAGKQCFGPMSRWLRTCGYVPVETDIDVNFWHPRDALYAMDIARRRARRLTGKKPIMVGHSYGGMLSARYGTLYPDEVSAVLTFGSPLSWPVDTIPLLKATVRFIMETKFDRESILGFIRDVALPPAAPTFAFWSAYDGVVNGHTCKLNGGRNIQVYGSHIGMIFNLDVYRWLARILSDPKYHFEEA